LPAASLGNQTQGYAATRDKPPLAKTLADKPAFGRKTQPAMLMNVKNTSNRIIPALLLALNRAR
jgi:hypothetical protein